MPWAFLDELGEVAYLFPPSIWPNQLHVGGAPRARFVKGYGEEPWYVVQDGIREPAALMVVGNLQTDRNESGTQALIDGLQTAAGSAAFLAHLAIDGTVIEALPLLGALPLTTTPEGIDGSIVGIALPLIPGGEWEGGAAPPPPNGPARYWRFRFDTHPEQYISLAEAAFVDNFDAPTVISDNPSNAIGGPGSDNIGAGLAFDGDPETMWESQEPSTWLGYDFGTPVEIFAVGLMASSFPEEAPMVWAVDSSDDGGTWVQRGLFTESTPWTLNEVRTRSL